ncbi:MAG: hypothetical protein M0029_10665 [Actinomycetota bacterium]|nr:hypothetical protein [Actinomycetota bacterium]
METLTEARLDADAPDPEDAAWGAVGSVAVPLAAVPLADQRNLYVRTAWHDRPYGRTSVAWVGIARHDDRLLVHLSWDGSDAPAGEFPDACAVLFPRHGGGPEPRSMGTPDEPVDVWLWRDRLPSQQGLPAAHHLVASGPGVFRPPSTGPDEVSARAVRQGTRWSVVLCGPRRALDGAGRIGVVIWDGANDERAGIGSASEAWTEVAS